MIRGLEGFLHDTQLLREESLSVLKNTRLGIDLSYYLREVLSHASTAEPLVAAIGGQPLALLSHIENDMHVLEQHRIKPVFVLNGLSPAKRTRPFSYEDRRPGLRKRAWEAYEAGNVTLAHQQFTASNRVHFPDLYRAVLRMFRHRHIDYMIAPYQATGQLVLLEQHAKQYVHAMYGPMELLAFDGVDNVIQHIDFKSGKFTFVSKLSILRELQCHEAEFLDAVLLAGMEYCTTFPALQDESIGLLPGGGGPPNLRAIVMLVKQYRSGFALCTQFAEHPAVVKSSYLDQFCHARTMIKFSLVLSSEGGVVVPLPLALYEKGPKPEIPSDLHEIFSFRLPDQALLYLSRGLMSSSVLGSLLSGYVIEPAPLDNGEALEYRGFVRNYLTETATSPRCMAVALACASLHPFWRQRKVSAVYWFQPMLDCPLPHEAPEAQQLLARIDKWHVSASVLEEELRRQSSSTIDMLLCLNTTAEASRVASTFASPDAPVRLEKKDEIVANTLWRLLEVRSFLTAEHVHTPYGRALHVALQHVRINDRLQEPLYLAVELLRAGVLHAELYSETSYSGGPSLGTEKEMQHTLLVMRALSLLPMTFKAQAWDAPLSRELLVFNSFAKALSRSLRSLTEMVTLSLLLRGESRQQREDYLDISLSLPFQADTNTGMGILIKCYLDALYTLHGGALQSGEETSDEVLEAKSTVVDMLVETFDNVRDVTHELHRASRFWTALMTAVEVLHEEKALEESLVQTFRETDAQLQPCWLRTTAL
ncbi:xpg i-region protein [Malassezia pachydermatis]|uniref:Xpg i-region protein n=1 Tax=Malassezia pachydermatis TaxID=77020 RepID=A0A0M9VMT6_9BASI|nr:xpg i-region protein [Malassezia pachydermatis]KOS12619.1 xpg i-region protein [Malassezia pachydermatis]